MENYFPSKKTVYVLYENEGNHNMFYDKNSRKDGYAIPWFNLREAIENEGYNFKPTFEYSNLAFYTDVACIISCTLLNQQILNSISKHPKEKCFLLIQEPPTIRPQFYDFRLTNYFGRIFTMFDDMVDDKKYFKFVHPQYNEKFSEDVPAFADKKLCVMVQSNHPDSADPRSDYKERKKAANFLSKTGEFDLFGFGWEGYSCWKGAFATGKVNLIKNYKFCLSYENMHDSYGYISERLFEPMYAGCIPIYLGAKNVCDYVPNNCFINLKDFSSYENLYNFMKNMDKLTYDLYIQAGREFINSYENERFTTKYLSANLIKHLRDIKNLAL